MSFLYLQLISRPTSPTSPCCYCHHRREKAGELKAEHPHFLSEAQQFPWKGYFTCDELCASTCPYLFLKELTSVCVSGQGEGQHRHDFSAVLFQVITNKGQRGRQLFTPCCQRDTPDQPLCSSEGFSSSKVKGSVPSQAHWKGKLLISRKIALLNCIQDCGKLWFTTLLGMSCK